MRVHGASGDLVTDNQAAGILITGRLCTCNLRELASNCSSAIKAVSVSSCRRVCSLYYAVQCRNNTLVCVVKVLRSFIQYFLYSLLLSFCCSFAVRVELSLLF